MVFVKGQFTVAIGQWSRCAAMSFKGQFIVAMGHSMVIFINGVCQRSVSSGHRSLIIISYRFCALICVLSDLICVQINAIFIFAAKA